jgi:hypothetical protein
LMRPEAAAAMLDEHLTHHELCRHTAKEGNDGGLDRSRAPKDID